MKLFARAAEVASAQGGGRRAGRRRRQVQTVQHKFFDKVQMELRDRQVLISNTFFVNMLKIISNLSLLDSLKRD
jgi:GTP cyclohydrolase III